MKNRTALLSTILILFWNSACWTMPGHEHHDATTTTTESGKQDSAKTFKHEMIVEGIRAEFEVMPLTSMGLLPIGEVKHHIMVKFFMNDSNQQIMKTKGEMKILHPSGKETVAPLRNYKGLFVTEFAFTEKGEYGFICAITPGDRKYVFQFQHME